jgi:hypothetical protein
LKAQTKGVAAQQELKLTGEAFAELKKAYVEAWSNSDPRDTAGREKIWAATTILTQVEKRLRSHVTNGKVAEKQLEAIRNKASGRRRKSSA